MVFYVDGWGWIGILFMLILPYYLVRSFIDAYKEEKENQEKNPKKKKSH
jgi:hypothetical protein